MFKGPRREGLDGVIATAAGAVVVNAGCDGQSGVGRVLHGCGCAAAVLSMRPASPAPMLQAGAIAEMVAEGKVGASKQDVDGLK